MADDFDTRMHRVSQLPPAENQGAQSEECRQASVAAIRGLWPLLRDTVRDMNVGDWLAVATLICAACASWYRS